MVCTHRPYIYRSGDNKLLISTRVVEFCDRRRRCVTPSEEFFDEHLCNSPRGVARILVIMMVDAQHVEELLDYPRRGGCHTVQLGFPQGSHGLVTHAWENALFDQGHLGLRERGIRSGERRNRV